MNNYYCRVLFFGHGSFALILRIFEKAAGNFSTKNALPLPKTL